MAEDQAGKGIEEQQEYFVPWHLPYHRAEVNGAAAAVANGLARKDEKKGTLVYNRYYHMFAERELERYIYMCVGLGVFPYEFFFSICCKGKSAD